MRGKFMFPESPSPVDCSALVHVNLTCAMGIYRRGKWRGSRKRPFKNIGPGGCRWIIPRRFPVPSRCPFRADDIWIISYSSCFGANQCRVTFWQWIFDHCHSAALCRGSSVPVVISVLLRALRSGNLCGSLYTRWVTPAARPRLALRFRWAGFHVIMSLFPPKNPILLFKI